MCKLYNMLNLSLDNTIAVSCNNQSMLKIIAKPPYAYHSRMKHLPIKEGFIYKKDRSTLSTCQLQTILWTFWEGRPFIGDNYERTGKSLQKTHIL